MKEKYFKIGKRFIKSTIGGQLEEIEITDVSINKGYVKYKSNSGYVSNFSKENWLSAEDFKKGMFPFILEDVN